MHLTPYVSPTYLAPAQVLNAASTVGETAFPYLLGLAFESGQYSMLGIPLSACI